MANVKIPTSFNIELEFETANILVRFFAWFIDALIRIAFSIAFVVTISRMHLTETWYWVLGTVFCFLPVVLYFLIFEVTMNGMSPGKMILGLKVRSMNGSKPTISQHLIRWIFRIIETPTFFFAFIPFISIIRSRFAQRL